MNAMAWCIHFAFLQTKRALDFIRRSKIMFLMRGMPGSGKTTIVKELVEKFPSAVVCSADDFMLGNKESYQFDVQKLTSAHELCRFKAAEACFTGKPVIVDNTNLKYYEFSFYCVIARMMSYTVLLVEPRTPWAVDPEQLAEKSVHGVPVGVCLRKLQVFRPLVALSYGWFLNGDGTDYVCRAARRVFGLMTAHPTFLHWYRDVVSMSTCSNAPVVFDSLFKTWPAQSESSQMDETDSANQIFEGYPQRNANTRSKPMKEHKVGHTHQVDSYGLYESRAKGLYLTTAYALRGSDYNFLQYAMSRLVKRCLGSVTELCISAFFFTPRTIGARVQLTAKQRLLWQQEDEFSRNIAAEEREIFEIRVEDRPYELFLLSNDEVAQLDDDLTGDCRIEDKTVDKFCPSSSDMLGATAHITLGAMWKEKLGQAGADLREIILLERRVKEAQGSDDTISCKRKTEALLDEFQIGCGVVRQYAGGYWIVYLDKPVRTDGIFTGSYFR